MGIFKANIETSQPEEAAAATDADITDDTGGECPQTLGVECQFSGREVPYRGSAPLNRNATASRPCTAAQVGVFSQQDG